jgi:hypothetical protein
MYWNVLGEILDRVKETDKRRFAKKMEERERGILPSEQPNEKEDGQWNLDYDGYHSVEPPKKVQPRDAVEQRQSKQQPTQEEIKDFLKDFDD